MKLDNLRNLIRGIIKEEIEARRLKIDEKSFAYDPANNADSGATNLIPHKRDDKSKNVILKDLGKLANEINSDITVVWDDHDDIMINYMDLLKIRITPRWENNYDVEVFVRNEDRIKIFGLTLDQLKEFIKVNFTNIITTKVDSAMDKVNKNRNAETKGSTPMVKKKQFKLKEPFDMEYTGKGKPSDPMEEVTEFKKQRDYKVQKPVKLRKKRVDKTLVIKNK